MATTPNYGWVTPAPTDLVTDLPADFEVFADAVDADLAGLLGGTSGQVLVKNSGTDHDFDFATDPVSDIVTTAGDVLYGTAADTLARLAIGTAGQVLKVNSGATAPEWGTVSVVPNGYTLLNSPSGTALTGAATITVSGISNQRALLIYVHNASSASAASTFEITFNADITGTNYDGGFFEFLSTGTAFDTGFAEDHFRLGKMGTSAGNSVAGGLFMDGANSTDFKPVTYFGQGSGTSAIGYGGVGIYKGTSAISSVSLFSRTGNFDAGTLFVYGAAV